MLSLVLGQGAKLALIGVLAGLGASWALTRWIESLLFGVSPADRVTFMIISLVLMAVALLACYIPARRAAKVIRWWLYAVNEFLPQSHTKVHKDGE